MGKEQQYCLNCDAALNESNDFCPSCGQKTNERLSISYFIESLASSLFSLDARLWRTLPNFLFHPGKVPKEFVKGKRKKYVSPIPMYFFISFLFFLVLTSTVVKEWDQKFQNVITNATDSNLTTQEKIASAEAELGDQSFLGGIASGVLEDNESLTQEDLDSIANEIDSLQVSKTDSLLAIGYSEEQILSFYAAESAKPLSYLERLGKKVEIRFKQSKGKGSIVTLFSQLSIVIVFILVLFTLLVWLLYIRNKIYLPEHFIHSSYLLNFLLFFSLVIIGLHAIWPTSYWAYAYVVLSTLYIYVSMKTFYGQSHRKTVVKTILLSFAGIAILLPISIMVWLTLFLVQYGQ